jgi:hypothetical protein
MVTLTRMRPQPIVMLTGPSLFSFFASPLFAFSPVAGPDVAVWLLFFSTTILLLFPPLPPDELLAGAGDVDGAGVVDGVVAGGGGGADPVDEVDLVPL